MNATPAWHWRHVLQAPHRIAFLLAMVVLAAAGLWWAVVQLSRAGAGPALPYALSPTVVHAAVMCFGFIPLFFAGFLFTAGPKWLGVAPPAARTVTPALVVQALGWMLWLLGANASATLSIAGALLAASGLVRVTCRFWSLIVESRVPDRLHAKVIGCALLCGCACVFGMAIATAFGEEGVAHSLILTGLWGFVVVVYVAVAHRMIPFFTSSALPSTAMWRPQWVLLLMLGMALFEAFSVWVDIAALRAVVELAGGAVLAWLAFRWGLVQSLRVRLLAMLHVGFMWLGLSLLLAGFTHAVAAVTGDLPLPLAPLHALTMGCLGSLMVAMVTRVSCGHSGRSLVADNLVWALFWLLQAGVVLRIAATLPLPWSQPLLTTAAAIWAGITLTWALRYGNWYGRPRADGRPG